VLTASGKKTRFKIKFYSFLSIPLRVSCRSGCAIFVWKGKSQIYKSIQRLQKSCNHSW